MADRCTDCNRILVMRAEWRALSRNERRRLYDTHSRIEAQGICSRDYNRRIRAGLPVPDRTGIAWDGGWVRVGLIDRPVGLRPVEGEMAS